MSIFANVFVGNVANDGTGEALRNAFNTINLNFANIASGNIGVVVNAPVMSVAGRTGNIILTTNDVIGSVSKVYVQNYVAAGNAYVDAVAASIGSTDVAVINANVRVLDANLGAATTNITTLFSNAAGQATQITGLQSANSALNSAIASTNANVAAVSVVADSAYDVANIALINSIAFTANSAVQEIEITGLRANITAANVEIVKLRSNINAANTASVNSNIGMKLYVDGRISTLSNSTSANASLQSNQIAVLNAGLNAANADITALQVDTVILAANIADITNNVTPSTTAAIISANTAMKGYVDNQVSILDGSWRANAYTQQTEIIGLRANITAANAALVSANAASIEYVTAQVLLINSNADSNVKQLTSSVNAANTASLAQGVALSQQSINLNLAMVANVNAANAAIITANTGMKSYVDTVNTLLVANAAAQGSQINQLRANITAANTAILTANTGMKNYVDTINSALIANAVVQTAEITDVRANVVAANAAIITANSSMKVYVDATVAPINATNLQQNIDINALRANITAANAAIITANTGMKSYVDSSITAFGANSAVQAVEIEALQANITASNASIITANLDMKSYVDYVSSVSWVANAAIQETQIVELRANITAANSVIVANTAILQGEIDTLFDLIALSNVTIPVIQGLVTSPLPQVPLQLNLGADFTRWNTLWLSANGININDATITAPSRDLISFGNTETGTFRIYSANAQFGNAVIDSNIPSTSPTTGALQIQGGAGVTGDLHIGGNLYVTQMSVTNQEVITTTEIIQGNLVANSGINSVTPTSGALVVVGGAGITKDITVGGSATIVGNVNVPNAVVNAGNVKISGNLSVTNQVLGSLYFNTGTIYIDGSPVTTSAASGFNGGNVQFQTNFTGVTDSVSSTTGQIVVAGGLGVSGNINSAKTITASNINVTDTLTVNKADIGSLTSPLLAVSGNLSVSGSIFQLNIPQVLNDISNYFDGNTCVFPLTVEQNSINSIIDSKDVEVSVNGLRLAPYVAEIRFPWITPYDSYKGFKISNGNVIIYSAPQVGEQAVLTVRSTSQTAQTRRYPFSASTIALGD